MTDKKKRIEPDASWKEIPMAGIIPNAGSAQEFKTGDWRVRKPIHDEDKCIHCLRCWVYCPDVSILVEDGKVVGIDYDHCKGCGICAKVCPEKVQAITMVSQSEE
ncbi:MAG TPA: 4Fe-4S binding protein [Firmicutes bacterium]|jgi:pyruvate ferredoxin oxidoreductase delta subunit|nr:4Fe-4S binding protein [Bacillota bacterium]